MNSLTIIGNVTRDAELRSTQTGVSVCSFTVAVNPKYKKENQEDNAQFFKVSVWRKLGEICGKCVKKGMKVAVVGAVELQIYKDTKGETRATLAVTADNVEFLSRVEGNSEDYSDAPQVHEAPSTVPNGFTDVSTDMFGDELPF